MLAKRQCGLLMTITHTASVKPDDVGFISRIFIGTNRGCVLHVAASFLPTVDLIATCVRRSRRGGKRQSRRCTIIGCYVTRRVSCWVAMDELDLVSPCDFGTILLSVDLLSVCPLYFMLIGSQSERDCGSTLRLLCRARRWCLTWLWSLSDVILAIIGSFCALAVSFAVSKLDPSEVTNIFAWIVAVIMLVAVQHGRQVWNAPPPPPPSRSCMTISSSLRSSWVGAGFASNEPPTHLLVPQIHDPRRPGFVQTTRA